MNRREGAAVERSEPANNWAADGLCGRHTLLGNIPDFRLRRKNKTVAAQRSPAPEAVAPRDALGPPLLLFRTNRSKSAYPSKLSLLPAAVSGQDIYVVSTTFDQIVLDWSNCAMLPYAHRSGVHSTMIFPPVRNPPT
ncbi:Protein of unknown function [Gryllus bimaculatus]|nr:Protein of unknown function [Gryllus bimaculatus]